MNTINTTNNSEVLIGEENFIYSMENPAYYDAKLKASILTSLTWYSNTPMEEINITVKHGVVTLSGKVPWMYQKMIITTMLQTISGVKGIENNITAANNPIATTAP
ncbi:MAG TPA: BON domain-containing protein [Bacteroidia bacterium]|nr:BON domain-containing protein [Bacteroidia bacterium]